MYDVAIVGSGPAGLTAAIYSGRAMLKTVVLEKAATGGLMAITDKLENYPGIDSISGFDLSMAMETQAKKFGAEIISKDVIRVEKKDEGFVLVTDEGELQARAVIYAAGSVPRKGGMPGEEEFTGRGVSYCAVCDGAFYRNLKVAVVGGGDSALKEALFLTRFASEVVIIHRRNEFRAEKVVQEEVRANPKISFILDSVVEKIEGNQFVEKIQIRNVMTGQLSDLRVDGVFIFIGYEPKVDPVRHLVSLSDSGRIKVDAEMKTGVSGLFAAGDVTQKLVNQVATAVGDGATAAVAAEHLLASLRQYR